MEVNRQLISEYVGDEQDCLILASVFRGGNVGFQTDDFRDSTSWLSIV